MATSSKKRKYVGDSTVKLIVGASKTPVHVHKAILCGQSTFFKSAFNSGFREGHSQEMALPEDDVDVVEALIEWLYTGVYNLLKEVEDEKDFSGNQDQARHKQATHVFLLAEKYDILRLKEHIIDLLFDAAKQGALEAPNGRYVTLVYRSTPLESGLRKLYTAWWCWKIDPSFIEQEKTQTWLKTQPRFSKDLLLAFISRLTKPGVKDPFKGTASQFYDKA